MTVDWKICSDCETIECVDSCAAGALKQCVRFLSVDELMKILMRDFPNRGSDGGVTFSDGEPLLHHELERILRSKFIIYTVLKISLRCLAKEFFIDPAYIAIFIEVHTMKKSFLRIN